MIGHFDDMIIVFRGANSYQSDSNKLEIKNFPWEVSSGSALDGCTFSVPFTTRFARGLCLALTRGQKILSAALHKAKTVAIFYIFSYDYDHIESLVRGNKMFIH